MKYMTLKALTITFLLTLSSCGFSTREQRESETIWAKQGTPARIVDKKPNKVHLPDGKGGWIPSKADLSGRIAIDEATLEYYQELHEKYGRRAKANTE